MEPQAMTELFEKSAARHSHLCPRQVLGVRIGLAGAAVLGLEVPRHDKRLVIILETDGCFADGIEVATGCSIGHRTLRVEDYGKIAAIFVDVESRATIRVAPQLDIRQRAYAFIPDEKRHYFAQLKAYPIMPVEELLVVQSVQLNVPIEKIVSRTGLRVNCSRCGEEIINEREIMQEDGTLCRACAGLACYTSVYPDPILFPVGQSKDLLQVKGEEWAYLDERILSTVDEG